MLPIDFYVPLRVLDVFFYVALRVLDWFFYVALRVLDWFSRADFCQTVSNSATRCRYFNYLILKGLRYSPFALTSSSSCIKLEISEDGCITDLKQLTPTDRKYLEVVISDSIAHHCMNLDSFSYDYVDTALMSACDKLRGHDRTGWRITVEELHNQVLRTQGTGLPT